MTVIYPTGVPRNVNIERDVDDAQQISPYVRRQKTVVKKNGK